MKRKCNLRFASDELNKHKGRQVTFQEIKVMSQKTNTFTNEDHKMLSHAFTKCILYMQGKCGLSKILKTLVWEIIFSIK